MDALTQIQSSASAQAVFKAIGRCLEAIGPHEVEVKKTSLHVTRGRAFLGVHPRKSGLLLNIVLSNPLEGDRVRKREQVSRNRWHNEVLIASENEINDELAGWIREAYELAQAASKA